MRAITLHQAVARVTQSRPQIKSEAHFGNLTGIGGFEGIKSAAPSIEDFLHKPGFSRLTSKGLAVIAMPILFSIGFILILKILLNEAQIQADRENRSKQIIASATALGSSVILTVTERYMTRFSRNPEATEGKLESASKIVEDKYEELQRLIPKNSEQGKIVERIGTQLRRGLEITANQEFSRARAKGFAQLSLLVERRKQMQDIYADLSIDTSKLIENEKKNQSSNSLNQKKYRQLIDIVLFCGIAGDVVMAIVLMYLFSSDITKRLGVVMDNSERLAEEKELNPLIGGQDELAELDAVFHDVAERLAQSRSKEREVTARLKSMVDTIPLGLIVIDGSGNISSISPSAVRLFGVEAEELTGKEISSLLRSKADKDQGWIKSILSEDWTQPRELQGVHSDGRVFPVEVISTKYEGGFVGHLLVVADITQRYEMEQLKQSFVSMVSHELRTPLTSIGACLKMLGRNYFGQLNAEGAQNVKFAENSVGRLVSLVNEILDVERMEAGNIAVSFEWLNLEDVLAEAESAVKAMADNAGVSISVSPTDVDVEADHNRLVQVVVNLVSNAVKFSPKGSTVSLIAFADDTHFEIQVKDQGRGVPEDQREQIFKRFHQVETGDAKNHGGAGLGLAICKAIVEAHGGEIGVRPNEDSGSIFWFRIPVQRVNVNPNPLSNAGTAAM